MITKTYTGADCICDPSCAEAYCAHCQYCCQEYAASHECECGDQDAWAGQTCPYCLARSVVDASHAETPAPAHTYTLEREDGDVTLWKRDDGKGLAARATNWRNARRSFARLLEESEPEERKDQQRPASLRDRWQYISDYFCGSYVVTDDDTAEELFTNWDGLFGLSGNGWTVDDVESWLAWQRRSV